MEDRRGVNFTGLLCGVVNVELVRRKRPQGEGGRGGGGWKEKREG